MHVNCNRKDIMFNFKYYVITNGDNRNITERSYFVLKDKTNIYIYIYIYIYISWYVYAPRSEVDISRLRS